MKRSASRWPSAVNPDGYRDAEWDKKVAADPTACRDFLPGAPGLNGFGSSHEFFVATRLLRWRLRAPRQPPES
jgi:hypothetical protein